MGLGRIIFLGLAVGIPTYYFLNKAEIDAKLGRPAVQNKINNAADKTRAVAHDAVNKVADNKDQLKKDINTGIDKV